MRSAAGSSGECNSREANTPTARLQGGVGARPHPISDGSEERDVTEGACPMMDQVTLSQLRDWPPGKVAAQPIEVLAALADSLAEMKTFVADAEARLNAGLDVRFGDRARQLRAADGKDSGRVRLGDGAVRHRRRRWRSASTGTRTSWRLSSPASASPATTRPNTCGRPTRSASARTARGLRRSAGCSSRRAPSGSASRGTRSRRAGKRRPRDGRPSHHQRRRSDCERRFAAGSRVSMLTAAPERRGQDGVLVITLHRKTTA